MTARLQPCEGIDRLVLFFASAPTRQGVLARRSLRRPAPDDAVIVQRLIGQMLSQSSEGMPGPVVSTIWRAHELMDLGCSGNQEGCHRIIEWMLTLQGGPGAFHQGCSRTRHTHHICEHFISGFFAPAPPEQRLAPIMLPNGKVFRAEPAARFAISCLAFRAAVRAEQGARPQVKRHLTSLLQLQEHLQPLRPTRSATGPGLTQISFTLSRPCWHWALRRHVPPYAAPYRRCWPGSAPTAALGLPHSRNERGLPFAR
ncbi:MAG: hypothetical protein K0S19_2127 [Geminicoccaceae bacterium]|nr:hypothetical protein [Geminicoccaceae bacterium]